MSIDISVICYDFCDELFSRYYVTYILKFVVAKHRSILSHFMTSSINDFRSTSFCAKINFKVRVAATEWPVRQYIDCEVN